MDPNQIHTELKLLRQGVDMMNKLTAKRLENLERFVVGNGDPGAKVRIDRLEQVQARYRWFVVTSLTTAIGVSVASVWAMVTG